MRKLKEAWADIASEKDGVDLMKAFLYCSMHEAKKFYDREKRAVSIEDLVKLGNRIGAAHQETKLMDYEDYPDSEYVTDGVDRKRPWIMIIDEASILDELVTRDDAKGSTTAQRCLRIAFSQVSSKRPVFGLFADTNSKITQILPSPFEDKSARQVDDEVVSPWSHGQPFYELHTSDINCDKKTYNIAKIHSNDLNERIAALVALFLLGRPVWKTATFGVQEILKAENIVRMALKKLLCSNHPLFSADLPFQESDYVRHLATLGARLAMQLKGMPICLERFLSSHMATCYHVSKDRECMHMGYPSEPSLAEASAQIMSNPAAYRLMMTTLLEKIKSGPFDVGKVGELVARLILLKVRDMLVPVGPRMLFSASIPLLDYLENLGNNNYISDPAKQHFEKYKDCHVFFTHFMQISKKDSGRKKMLKTLIKRCAAAAMDPYQKRCDAMLPFYRVKDGMLEVAGRILFQFKCWHSRKDAGKVFDEGLQQEEVFSQCALDPVDTIGVLMLLKRGIATGVPEESCLTLYKKHGVDYPRVIVQGIPKCIEGEPHQLISRLIGVKSSVDEFNPDVVAFNMNSYYGNFPTYEHPSPKEYEGNDGFEKDKPVIDEFRSKLRKK